MTAIALFDVLASSAATPSEAGHPDERTGELAAKLVESSLADWKRVRQYEADFSHTSLDNLDRVLEIERTIYALHQQWEAEATQVYARAEQAGANGHVVPNVEDLMDAICRTRARLMATPEKFLHALQQVQRGEAIPMKELRDDLVPTK